MFLRQQKEQKIATIIVQFAIKDFPEELFFFSFKFLCNVNCLCTEYYFSAEKCSSHTYNLFPSNILKGKVKKFFLCTAGIGVGSQAHIHSRQTVICSL